MLQSRACIAALAATPLKKVTPPEKLRRLADNSSEPLVPYTARELLSHIESEKFSDEARTVEEWQKVGYSAVGLPHPSRPGDVLAADTLLTSAEWHTVKHVGNGEWPAGTTTTEYLADVVASVAHETAVLHVGRDQQRKRSGICTDATALKKAAPPPNSLMLTIYDPERRRILTGFPLSAKKALEKVNRWTNHRSFP